MFVGALFSSSQKKETTQMYIIILNGERLKDFPYVLGTHMQKDKSKQTLIHALHHT